MEANRLIRIIFLVLISFTLVNCKKEKKNNSLSNEPNISLINAFIEIDTNSFKHIDKEKVIGLREKSIDNTLFSYLKIEEDTIMFYFDYLNPKKYDRKYVRNGKVLNFVTLNNIEGADKLDFYEPFSTRFQGNEFYKDKNDNILIKTDIYWGGFDNGYRLIQILTKTECLEYFELTSTNSGRYPNKEYYDDRIIKN